MTQFEIAKHIRNSLLNSAMTAFEYEWDGDFTRRHIQQCIDRIKETEILRPIVINRFTRKELLDLGFKRWDKKGLMLIPLWITHFIKPEFKGACINEGAIQSLNVNTIDKDVRFGVLAYGIYPRCGGDFKHE